jgi:UDP-N-acetylmuramate dehydrogenase
MLAAGTERMTSKTWEKDAEAALLGLADHARLGLMRDVPLASRTYIGVGGPAAFFLAPEDPEALGSALERLSECRVPFDFLGAGSNLVVADAGPSFVVVSSERLSGEPRIEGDRVTVGSGYSVPRLVQILRKAGLAGLEFAEGIPGSVGGAVRMNAGWHEGEFGGSVAAIQVVTRTGAIEEIAAGPGTFAYRRSPGLGDRFVAGAVLRLTPDDPERIAYRMRGYRDLRVRTQPAGERNAGCMFKNPPGDHAGRLIDACGLKGLTVGRAQVSPIHANFFINQGGATFKDVRSLMDAVREAVLKATGRTLEPEVVLWT